MRSLLSTVILFSAISGICAQYYVVNYPEQQQQQYYYQQQQQNYQQLYRPQPAAYQQQLVQQPQYQQQVYQQQVYQPVAQPQLPPVQYIPQQQYQQLSPPSSQQYQQVQPQPVQQYQQSQPMQYQQIPQAALQPVRPQPQRPQVSNVQEKITPPEIEKAVKVVSVNTYEFDLPPPPPSRFLPDEERVKILQNTKQVDQAKQTRPKRPHQRIMATSEGRTHRTGHQEQPRPSSLYTTSTPSPTTTTAALTTTVAPEVNDHVSHLSPNKKNPNKYFLQCCKEKKVAKSCESRCNFDHINKKILTAMFLGSDPCPQRYGLDLFACAAQDSDHTPCCRIKNVQRTSAGEKCLAFCNLRPDSHFQADASYLPCWAVLNDVKTCFKDAIISGEIIQ